MAGPKFATLDALRGLAALAVVFFHLRGAFGAAAPAGYLAVDLFFLMSGFVVASAYEARLLAGWSAGAFLAVRLKRLWPVYALGAALGLACFAAIRLLRPDAAFAFPPVSAGLAFAMSLLFLPQFANYAGPSFPFNSASWSLSVELFGNIVYALLARSLRTPVLILFAAAGFAGIAIVAFKTGDLDAGVTYGTMAGGYFRFLFSFSLGVLIWRAHDAGKLAVLVLPWWAPLIAAAISFSALGGAGAVRDLAVVGLLYPAILIVSLHSPVSPRTARVFGWAGAVSYPLYAVHPPLVQAAQVLTQGAPYALAAAAVAAVALAALAARYFDRPLQALLRRPRTALPA